MLKHVAKKLLSIVLYRPLPSPSETEKANLIDLQTTFRELPTMEIANALPSEAMWLSNINHLKELVLSQNPRKFLRWGVVGQTMFVSYAGYISMELNYLKSRPDWNTRWRSVIKESFVGHPVPYIFYPSSSGNLIHHSYHIARFEEKTKIKVQDMDFVFEFGGGYGSMCRLFHNLGFRGKYIIFDLPPFSALQRYFLKTLGLPVQSISDFYKSKNGIVCISDDDLLRDILINRIQETNKMFIATWSISETPVSIRDKVLPLVSDFQAFLIAYQDKFGEMNNLDFFANWQEKIDNITFDGWRINHMPGNNYYLVGSNSHFKESAAIGRDFQF